MNTTRTVTVIAGGVGGGRFARGVRALGQQRGFDVSVVVNVGDDMWLTGVRVCPDLDSVMYALGDANDTDRGWGRKDESERVSAELTAYGVGWPWFTLGDLDLGTHLARTSMLRDGLTLTEATRRLAGRWQVGATILPASDDEVETLVDVERDGRRQLIHFEEWWVHYRTNVPTLGFVQRGVETARISDEADRAIRDADVVLIAPSNPVVSIGTILGIPGVRTALADARGPVVGVSPVIGGAPVRGMADKCCEIVGIEGTAAGIARHYGSRSRGGLLDGWLVDDVDRADVESLSRREGIPSRAVPLWMHDDDATAEMAAAALDLAGSELSR
jgi:LPPG:FO 2-phospho-L-lactate transferase